MLRHTFAHLLTGDTFDLEGEFRVPDRVGPPGSEVVFRALKKSVAGEHITDQALHWAVRSIFSQIVHLALMVETELWRDLSVSKPGQYSPEKIKIMMTHTINAIVAYLKSDGDAVHASLAEELM